MKEWATPGRPERARSRTPAISPQDKRLSDDRMVPCPIATENRGSRKRQRTESRIIQLSASPQIETPDNTIVAEDVAKGDSEEQENDARAMHQREDEEEFRLWRQDKSVSVFRRQSQQKHPFVLIHQRSHQYLQILKYLKLAYKHKLRLIFFSLLVLFFIKLIN